MAPMEALNRLTVAATLPWVVFALFCLGWTIFSENRKSRITAILMLIASIISLIGISMNRETLRVMISCS